MTREFDFIGKQKIWFSVSGIVILVGLVFLFARGLNLGIDFTGGTILDRGFDHPVTAAEVQDTLASPGLADLNLDSSLVQISDNGLSALIRTKTLNDDEIKEVDTALAEKFGAVDVRRTEMVGPTIGAELVRNAIWAVVLGWIGILIYVSIRFEYRFGVAAIIALVHDILVIVGVFAIIGREVNSPFVAALLTVVGYSINDTIVIFDRIRENVRLRKRESWKEIANKSINETLRRTINTNLTTLLVIVALYVFGGETLKDFILAMLLGAIAGTYSTVFIASPIWVAWKTHDDRKRQLAKAA